MAKNAAKLAKKHWIKAVYFNFIFDVILSLSLLLAEINPIFPYFRPSRRAFKLVSFISLIAQMYLLTK